MRNLKRALSLLLSSTMVLGMVVMGGSAAGYQDVDDTHHKEAIEVLQAVGIMTGDENGDFNPDGTVTRNQMAVIMANLMAYNVATYKGTSPFTDVPSWAEPYVAACYTNGITAGIGDNLYGGDQEVTTSQAALMIMKALGYFQFQSDFGSDWQLSTVTQGNKIDLFNDVNSGVKDAMSRNDVAQLVLNGLESGMVEADDSTINVTTPDGTVVEAGKVNYNLITSGENYATAIDAQLDTTNNVGGSTGRYTVELGEKLYQGKLTKDEDGRDHFNRPASIWAYDNKEVGTYTNEADYTYTTSITNKALYNTLGANVVDNIRIVQDEEGNWVQAGNNTLSVYWNGEFQGNVVPNKTTDTYSETGTGTLTQIYIDTDANNNKHIVISMMDTFLAEVVRVNEGDSSTIVTLNYLDGHDYGVNGAGSNATGRQTSIELDSTDLVDGDRVLVTLYEDTNGNYSIETIQKAETVTGTVTAVKSVYDQNNNVGKYAVMDGTEYKYVNNTFAEDLADTDLLDPTLNAENTLYLDTYGNMIAFEATERYVDYLYVEDSIDALGGVDVLATFADGSSATAHVTKLNDQTKGFASEDIDEGVYAYTKQGDNYQLLTLVDCNGQNLWETPPAFDDVNNRGSFDDGASYQVDNNVWVDGTGVVAGTNDMITYTIKNGVNAIQATTKPAGNVNAAGTTQNVVSLANSTIFVDVEGGVVYTGYNEVPTMTDISFFVVYNKQLNADVVFITDGADNSTSDSYFLILDETPVATKNTSDGTQYFEYKVMVDDKQTTVTFKGRPNVAIEDYGMYRIDTITPEGYITAAEHVDTFDQVVLNGSVVTEKTSGTIRMLGDPGYAECKNNLLTAYGETIYAYNKDTVFIQIEMKEKENGQADVNRVSVSNANAINTINDNLKGYGNVYVMSVADKDARTPLATLVYIVTPHENDANVMPGYDATTVDVIPDSDVPAITVDPSTAEVNGATVSMDITVNLPDLLSRASAKLLQNVQVTYNVSYVAGGVTKTLEDQIATVAVDTETGVGNMKFTLPEAPDADTTVNVTITAAEKVTTPVAGQASIAFTGGAVKDTDFITTAGETFDVAEEYSFTITAASGKTVKSVTANPSTNVTITEANGTWTVAVAANAVADQGTLTITVTMDETVPPVSDLQYAPGTFKVDTTGETPAVTIYQHDDTKVYTEAELVAIVKQAGYTITALDDYANVATGTDGFVEGTPGIVCTVKVESVVALTVDGDAVMYVVENTSLDPIDMTAYLKTNATLVKADDLTAALDTFKQYTWTTSADAKLVNAYAFAQTGATNVYLWDAEKNEYGTTDIEDKTYIPCDAKIQVKGTATATTDEGAVVRFTVGGTTVKENIAPSTATTYTYEVSDLGSKLDKDGKLVIAEVKGYKLSVNGTVLPGLFADTDDLSDLDATEMKALGLTNSMIGSYVAVATGDDLIDDGSALFTIDKGARDEATNTYPIEFTAGTVAKEKVNKVTGTITLRPVVEVNFSGTTGGKFVDIEGETIINREYKLQGTSSGDFTMAEEAYVVKGTEFTLKTAAGTNFGSGSENLNKVSYGIAYKALDDEGNPTGEYTVITGDKLTVTGEATSATLSTTVTVDKAVVFDVVTTSDEGATWTALAEN